MIKGNHIAVLKIRVELSGFCRSGYCASLQQGNLPFGDSSTTVVQLLLLGYLPAKVPFAFFSSKKKKKKGKDLLIEPILHQCSSTTHELYLDLSRFSYFPFQIILR